MFKTSVQDFVLNMYVYFSLSDAVTWLLHTNLCVDRPALHEEDPCRCRGLQYLGWRAGVSGQACSGICPPLSCRTAQRPGRSAHYDQVNIEVVIVKLSIRTPVTLLFCARSVRFLFILLGPLGKGPQYHEIGRSIATLMTDEVREHCIVVQIYSF